MHLQATYIAVSRSSDTIISAVGFYRSDSLKGKQEELYKVPSFKPDPRSSRNAINADLCTCLHPEDS
jgi:hypothetical protein